MIGRTPYIRNLTGDTVWDIDNMIINNSSGGISAILEEIPDVRGVCTVTVKGGEVDKTLQVPYGNTFTKKQVSDFRAPDTKTVINPETGKEETHYFDHRSIDKKIENQTFHVSDCYYPEFHFAVWNDYEITPIYSTSPTGDPTSDWRFVTIDYIETSRNRWTTENNQNELVVTDRVVADMDITFNDGANLILESFDQNGNNAYKLGVIFEQVGTTDANGQFDKAELRKDEDVSKVKDRVRAVLAANSNSGTIADAGLRYGTTNGFYYTRIDISENTVSTFNRSEFARSFSTASVRNKVFRVYAYMILPGNGDDNIDDNEIVLSGTRDENDEPYYFTI